MPKSRVPSADGEGMLPRRARVATVPGLVLVALATCTTSAAALEPDRSLDERQRAVLEEFASRFVPLASYDESAASACTDALRDVRGLLSRLELHRRGGSQLALAPESAEPLALWIAESALRLQGEPDAPGPCASRPGGPRIEHVAAELGLALHRYGGSWSAATSKAIARLINRGVWPRRTNVLHNMHISIPVAMLLVGEATGRSKMWQSGKQELEAILQRTLDEGGVELQSPHYSVHHLEILPYLLDLRDDEMRALGRSLLEYELLVHAHLYLPGGGIGAPHSRDFAGYRAGRTWSRDLAPALWLLIGDPEIDFSAFVKTSRAGAAGPSIMGYVLPEVIRSIFLDKGDGYEFHAREGRNSFWQTLAPAVYGEHVKGGRGFNLWHAVVLPGGRAIHGLSYGYGEPDATVTSGTAVRCLPCDQNFAILYQYEPRIVGDVNELGVARGGDADPDDGLGEGYDFERMLFHHAAISLWDPSDRASRVDPSLHLDRRVEGTRVYLPNWGVPEIGGRQLRTTSGWRVGQVGEVFVAYLPLGTLESEEVRDDFRYEERGPTYPGYYTFLRLRGRSGGITELATTSEFGTLESYAQDLEGRHVSFLAADPTAGGYPSAEFDTHDANGQLVRMRLEFRPNPSNPLTSERRSLDREPPLGDSFVPENIETDLLRSPWVHWNERTGVLTVSRQGYGSIVYDTRARTIEELPPQAAGATAPELRPPVAPHFAPNDP
jgi:hypothetical protein